MENSHESSPQKDDFPTKKSKKAKNLNSTLASVNVEESELTVSAKRKSKSQKKSKRESLEYKKTKLHTVEASESEKKSIRRKKDKGKDKEVTNERSLGKKSSSAIQTTNPTTSHEHQTSIALEGGDVRVNKFLRLMGAKKAGNEAGVQQLANVYQVQNEIEQQFSSAMDIKNSRKKGRKQGLGS